MHYAMQLHIPAKLIASRSRSVPTATPLTAQILSQENVSVTDSAKPVQ